MDTKTVATEAATVVNEIAKVEPWAMTILPMLIPGAAPIAPLIEEFAPIILTFAARALTDIAKSNNSDLPSALIELFQHLTPGKPNSPILSPTPDHNQADRVTAA